MFVASPGAEADAAATTGAGRPFHPIVPNPIDACRANQPSYP
jgi:hypothetical protein